MATILQIENYERTTRIDLTDNSNISVVARDLEREISYGDNLITRTYTLRATGNSRGSARNRVNELISLLRQAVYWREDAMESESVFLRERADGENITRLLIVDYEARVVTRMPGIDPFQSNSNDLFIQVALTLQNHREELFAEELSSVSSTGSAIGRKYTLTAPRLYTKPARIQEFVFSAGAAVTEQYWIGLQPYTGGNFIHIWRLNLGTAGFDAVLTGTSPGRYSTRTVEVDFNLYEHMARRLSISVFDVHSAIGSTSYNNSRGVFMPLLRYKVNGTGAIMARLGVYSGKASYNEARLLQNDGLWHFMPAGVIMMPTGGWRKQTTASRVSPLQNVAIYIDAQRLGGTATLTLDTITFIPYHSYIHIQGARVYSSETLFLITHEDFKIEAFSGPYVGSSTITKWATVADQNNWRAPIPSRGMSNRIDMVVAAESESAGQIAGDNVVSLRRNIVPAWEAFRYE